MCGIVGGVDRAEPTSRSVIAAALKRMQHRGPDAEGIYENAPAFLGHRRLSIIDLDPRANQPMRLGPLVISYNGEIYNYRQVRRDLERLGDRFGTQSDTEVILAAFRREGIACLERFEGMFAFAIWNEEQKTLTLARDRFGEKPLVYYHDNERFLFASEISALETLLGRSELEMDRESISLYFQLSYIPAPYSPYKNMRQLGPGSWLQFDTVSGRVRMEKYYVPTPQPRAIREKEAVEELRSRLTDAVKLRMAASDVLVATFLSGGVDSSILSVLAANARPDGVRAYSIAFPEDPGFDESPYARQVAAYYPAIRHTVIDVTEKALLDFAERTLSMLGEPFADASIIPTAFLCSQVEEKVILGGDGADEIFAGYGVYAAMRTSARMPGWLKHRLRLLPKSGNPQGITNGKLRALALFHSHLRDTPLEEYLSWRSYASGSQLEQLGISTSSNNIPHSVALDTLSDLLALDISYNLPNDMLKKVDLASMQHSVEVRLPYLDRGLVEFALSLPEKLLIHKGQRKYVLREAFSDVLPEAIFTRRKQGFLLPIRKWFKNGMLRDKLSDLAQGSTVLNQQTVMQLLEEHQKGIHDHSVVLWSSYVFLNWQKNHAS
jgi:asparagine synthase (glutamine-hydrolysing)